MIFQALVNKCLPKKFLLKGDFHEHFKFSPHQIQEGWAQKEALILLVASATVLVEKAQFYREVPKNNWRRDDYMQARNSYQAKVDLINYYLPGFLADIPHWSELPPYLERLMRGEKMNIVLSPRQLEADAA
ncbi:MAG: hypothetical protein AAB519_02550 [Patescibacteria group bacterium]